MLFLRYKNAPAGMLLLINAVFEIQNNDMGPRHDPMTILTEAKLSHLVAKTSVHAHPRNKGRVRTNIASA